MREHAERYGAILAVVQAGMESSTMEMSLPRELEIPMTTVISGVDLQIVAEMVEMRLPLRAPEQRRVARARQVLAAEAELARAVSAHTQHALISCQGSHGAANLAADTAALYAALVGYAAIIREVADEYRALVNASETPLPLLQAFQDAKPLQLS
jgi:hypothetical protein